MVARLFVTLAALLGLALGLGAVGAGAPVALARTFEAPGGHGTVQVEGDALSRKRAGALALKLEALAPRRVAVVVVARAPDGVAALAERRFQALALGRDDLAIAIATGPGEAAVHVGDALRERGLGRAAIAEVTGKYFPRYARDRIPDMGALNIAHALVNYRPVGPREDAMPPWVIGTVIGTLVGLAALVGLLGRYGKAPSGVSSSGDPLERLRGRVREQREAHDYHDHGSS